MRKIQILVVEDNRVLRDGIVAMLNEQADMRVVASIESSNKILLKARQIKPHVILMDMGMNIVKDMPVVKLIKEKMPDAKVIGMGFIPTQSDIIEFVEAGASGFILKVATVKEFLWTVRSVANGEKVLPPSLTDSLFSHVAELALKKKKGKTNNIVKMTQREREIIVLIAEGLSNKEIAERLNIATHTVKSHVHNIMEKLALHTRLQIAVYTREGNE
jgi:DNA-binding NarL/FixJ family response regulator